MQKLGRPLACAAVILAGLALGACQYDRRAGEMASDAGILGLGMGAATGAGIGLLAGDPLTGLGIGAAVGFAVGFVGGAIASTIDPPGGGDLAGAIGRNNAAAMKALIECRHDEALVKARAGEAEQEPGHHLAALWIQAMVFEETGATDEAFDTYKRLVALEAELPGVDIAFLRCRRMLEGVEFQRVQRGRPPRCE